MQWILILQPLKIEIFLCKKKIQYLPNFYCYKIGQKQGAGQYQLLGGQKLLHCPKRRILDSLLITSSVKID